MVDASAVLELTRYSDFTDCNFCALWNCAVDLMDNGHCFVCVCAILFFSEFEFSGQSSVKNRFSSILGLTWSWFFVMVITLQLFLIFDFNTDHASCIFRRFMCALCLFLFFCNIFTWCCLG